MHFKQLVNSLHEEDRRYVAGETLSRAVEKLDLAFIVRVHNKVGNDRYQRTGNGLASA